MSERPDEGEVAHWRDLLASRSPYVIGCDEVGMGCWAGPMFVAATLYRSDWSDPRVKDSKRYSGQHAHQQRTAVLRDVIRPTALHIETACMSAPKLDEVGIGEAWMILMRRAILGCLQVSPNATVVVDGDNIRGLPGSSGQVVSLVGADNIVASVSAASVVAKVTRDTLMRRVGPLYPQYGFERNVGYGSAFHEKAIETYGICPLHRRSYAPIRRFIKSGRVR